jgi:NADP-dependent 3-hydroxy acid dehydrogenase YdfG
MMLKGKTALITGGVSRIGLATAQLMHNNGARVVIAGRDASKLEIARQEIGKDVLALQVDVLSCESVVTMVKNTPKPPPRFSPPRLKNAIGEQRSLFGFRTLDCEVVL